MRQKFYFAWITGLMITITAAILRLAGLNEIPWLLILIPAYIVPVSLAVYIIGVVVVDKLVCRVLR